MDNDTRALLMDIRKHIGDERGRPDIETDWYHRINNLLKPVRDCKCVFGWHIEMGEEKGEVVLCDKCKNLSEYTHACYMAQAQTRAMHEIVMDLVQGTKTADDLTRLINKAKNLLELE